MALEQIEPFCYRTYRDKTQDFALWLTNYVQINKIYGRVGWIAWFKNYKSSWYPSGPIPLKGVLQRAEFHRKLKASYDHYNRSDDYKRFMDVVNEIMDWGNMDRYPSDSDSAEGIRWALYVLWNEKENLAWPPEHKDGLRTGRIAAMSKLYEMFDPHKWTIYDSRVATALACLVQHFWKESGEEKDSEYLRFCIPARKNKRDWKRPEGFRGCTTHLQACLAFIYASWLLRQIAEIMRSDLRYGIPPTVKIQHAIQPLDGNWQVYHVEMALWMLGDSSF